MPISITTAPDAKYHLTVENEPEYVVPLSTAPPGREPILNKGTWLIVSFSIWTLHDRKCVAVAVEFAKKRQGRLRLGVRAFDDFSENESWIGTSLPRMREANVTEFIENGRKGVALTPILSRSPIWVVLNDGHIVAINSGPLGFDEVEAFVDRALVGRKDI